MYSKPICSATTVLPPQQVPLLLLLLLLMHNACAVSLWQMPLPATSAKVQIISATSAATKGTTTNNTLMLPIATTTAATDASNLATNSYMRSQVAATVNGTFSDHRNNKYINSENSKNNNYIADDSYRHLANNNKNNDNTNTNTYKTLDNNASTTTTTTWLFNSSHLSPFTPTSTPTLIPTIPLSTDTQTNELDMEMSYHSYCLAHRNTFVGLFTLVLYALVCLLGLFGNTLVIYVVLRFSKMQTVTNIYILNLAIADECFLIGIPVLLYTMRICSWQFSELMCKAYMVSTSITQFTSSIFLVIMSADRYLAVCHPISSPRYRTLHIAKLVSIVAWLTSAVLMLPVILYASTVRPENGTHLSCNIEWSEGYKLDTGATFILYTFFLGFATPLCFILCFYYMVIRKLHAVGAKHRSKEKRRCHRKVTRLVLIVITIYVLCWLPHWIAQLALINTNPAQSDLSRLEIAIFLLLSCLVYSNSAMNPILYAFLSDNFRKSFFKAFTCMTQQEVNAQLQVEPSVFTKQGSRKRGSKRSMCASSKQEQQQQQQQQQAHRKQSTAAIGNNYSSTTTTSSTTTADREKAGVVSLEPTSDINQLNGRVPVLAEDVILVLDHEQTVSALVEREPENRSVIMLQTDL